MIRKIVDILLSFCMVLLGCLLFSVGLSIGLKVAISVALLHLLKTLVLEKTEKTDGTLEIVDGRCQLNFNIDEIAAKKKQFVKIKVLGDIN